MKTLNTPPIKILVDQSYLKNDVDELVFEEGYLLSVKCEANRPLFFTVYLESGAVFSGLPLTALYCPRHSTMNSLSGSTVYSLEELQPYTCIGDNATIIQYDFLKDAQFKIKLQGQWIYGTYLFTIDYFGGLADDPEQFKTHNVGVLDTGELIAYPNNKMLFVDGFFAVEKDEFPKYNRRDIYYKGPK